MMGLVRARPRGLWLWGGVFDVSGVVGIAFGVWLLGVVMGLSKRDDGIGAGSAQRDVSVVGGVVCDV